MLPRSMLLLAVTAGMAGLWAVAGAQEKKAPVAKPAATKAAAEKPAVAKTDEPVVSDADEALIEAVAQSAEAFIEAFNGHDAAKLAAAFLPRGEMAHEDGTTFAGRELIQAEYAAMFKQHPEATVEIQLDDVRFLADNLAIENGTAMMRLAPDGPVSISEYVAIHSKTEEGWKLALVRTVRSEDETPEEHLQPLGWLVGDWIDESPDSLVRTRIRWSEDRAAIVTDFTVQARNEDPISGTHRIGWDPQFKKIRSWIFDSKGGNATGLWTRVDEAWIVKLTGVTPDGEPTSMTAVYAPSSSDSFIYRATDRTRGDEAYPDVEVVVVRKAPDPKVDEPGTEEAKRDVPTTTPKK